MIISKNAENRIKLYIYIYQYCYQGWNMSTRPRISARSVKNELIKQVINIKRIANKISFNFDMKNIKELDA